MRKLLALTWWELPLLTGTVSLQVAEVHLHECGWLYSLAVVFSCHEDILQYLLNYIAKNPEYEEARRPLAEDVFQRVSIHINTEEECRVAEVEQNCTWTYFTLIIFNWAVVHLSNMCVYVSGNCILHLLLRQLPNLCIWLLYPSNRPRSSPYTGFLSPGQFGSALFREVCSIVPVQCAKMRQDCVVQCVAILFAFAWFWFVHVCSFGAVHQLFCQGRALYKRRVMDFMYNTQWHDLIFRNIPVNEFV